MPLSSADFTEHTSVRSALDQMREYLAQHPEWSISDIVDTPADGQRPHQYVDLVMEGGGMLGIALVGYVYALEQAGIRFLRLGGTSAGSINALLMAAAGPRQEASTKWIIEQLANQNFYDFVDGDEDAKDFTGDLLRPNDSNQGLGGWLHGLTGKAKLFSDGLQVIDNLRDDKGLHHGDVFRQWLQRLLNQKGVNSINKLVALRRQVPAQGLQRLADPLYGRPEVSVYMPEDLGRIAIVAADVTTQTKVVFPEMAPLYWSDWKGVHPADMVRASMSVPLFFEPYTISGLPGRNQSAPDNPYAAAWDALGYTGEIPESVLFVDGGIMSNFPIDLFHDNTQVPAAPTFGIKLGTDRASARPTESLPQYLGAIFDAARTQYDFDFIRRNSDYRHLVHCLNVDGFNWLDFQMSDKQKLDLFAVGVRGAVEFLLNFDWQGYKKLRAAKVEVVKQAQTMDAEKARPHEASAVELEWPGGMKPGYMRAQVDVSVHG
ncbi:patatin-like phospholipase family protein [Hymenobacter sp. GOD-10R]|uniref:patatin-like phospholipase family protein n=1 Tax=Hymenobacter sp. GOD-10R TaxID=3093922 RepID=UPI002D781421|nr:patatin-like phospholipase family protein [Hymenobacter sp. GOD-10R]WRQ28931.1 patatin-like phospholipase family protein [Hymenobacter sp. GOD-10R]